MPIGLAGWAHEALDFLAPEKVALSHAAVSRQVLVAIETGRLILIGSGPLPQKCLSAIRAVGGSVPFLVEYEPRYWGREVLGTPILSPHEAMRRAPAGALFIAAIWSPNHRYRDTCEWICNFGVADVLPVPALFWAIPEALGAHYQLAPPLIFAERREAIENVLDALGDETSRSQFISHLRWRVTLDPQYLPEPDRAHMYFDPRLFTLGDDAVIADVGAFDGDSLRIFLHWQGARFGAYHAFEPDPVSFSRLTNYCRELPRSIAERVHPRQMAAAAEPGMVRFGASGKPGSQAVADGQTAVEGGRLDDYFAGGHLDYLKLDVEGAERDALAGAWRSIERDRPVLATAVYHQAHDIFDLPSMVFARTPGYTYALRSYDYDGIDLVFYAIPSERAVTRSSLT